MRQTTVVITLGVLFLLTLANAMAQSGNNQSRSASAINKSLAGKLTSPNGVIANAAVSLTYYKDAGCVKYANSTSPPSEEEEKKFKGCYRELEPILSDREGHYKFSNLSPGWYSLKVRWHLAAKPESSSPLERWGEFLIAYMETKETPKKYSALAQGEIFFFSGKEGITKDLTYVKK